MSASKEVSDVPTTFCRSGYDKLYMASQMLEYGQQCREAALLDAMNATRAFGKTGEVIAVIIAALKEKKE